MFFEKLKSGTAGLHQEIEKANPILKTGFRLDQYCHYLRMLGDYYSGVEKEMLGFASRHGSPIGLEERRRSHFIQKDLAALPCADSRATDKVIYRHRIDSLGSLIGTLYVLEGATLGSQIIYRSLKPSLQLTDDQLHFFRGYGDKTGAMWKSLRESVETLEFNQDDALQAAREVFADQLEIIKILNHKYI